MTMALHIHYIIYCIIIMVCEGHFIPNVTYECSEGLQETPCNIGRGQQGGEGKGGQNEAVL